MASNGIPLRRNACQMFGIYRSRTPDKMAELKPNRQTKVCFLTAVITGVTLVVGLSLLDVSTNATSMKSTPVLHLTRHRQDLLPVNPENKNTNLDDIYDEDVIGSVKEITTPINENKTKNVDTVTTPTIDFWTKSFLNSREARTKLFSVDKSPRTNIVKEYFIDGRHDPKSLGYYILQKQNGEYYLKNYSEPAWGTRIQRRFGNRIYPSQSEYREQGYENNNKQYINRNDNLNYNTNIKQLENMKIKQNFDIKENRENPYHLAPFRRLTSTLKLDNVDDRIQNNVKQNQNDLTNDANQLPPYEFTPIPIFSDSYAQLDPYKNNAKIKSIQEVMKYLTVSPKLNRPSTTSIPRMITPDNLPAETTINQKIIPNSGNNNNSEQNTKKRKKGIRFTGTYKMPIEPEDLQTGSSSLFETLLPPPLQPPLAKPYSGRPNGFSEIKTDPFANFRPSDPSEINYLLSPPSMNFNRNKQIGSMFINNIRTSTMPPNRYFPKPPFEIKKHPRPGNEINSNPIVTPSTNGHTVAVFKPPPDTLYNSNNHPSNDYKRPSYQNVKRKRKPVSVTLDIYPMAVDNYPDHSSTINKHNINVNSSTNKDIGLDWISPLPSMSEDEDENEDSSSSSSDSHMVVHLNVYPKGITRNTRAGKGRRPMWNTPATPRSLLSQKSAEREVDFPAEYEDYKGSSNIKNGKGLDSKNQPKHMEYMDYDFQEERETGIPISFYDNTQYRSPITNIIEKIKNNSYNITPNTFEDIFNSMRVNSNQNTKNLSSNSNNMNINREKQINIPQNEKIEYKNLKSNYDDEYYFNTNFTNSDNNPYYSLLTRNDSQNDTDYYTADYPMLYY